MKYPNFGLGKKQFDLEQSLALVLKPLKKMVEGLTQINEEIDNAMEVNNQEVWAMRQEVDRRVGENLRLDVQQTQNVELINKLTKLIG